MAALDEHPERAISLVVAGFECYLPLAALVDLDMERERIGRQLGELAGEIARSEKLLGNQGFVAKAPEAVVGRERDKLADLRERRDKLEARLQSLS